MWHKMLHFRLAVPRTWDHEPLAAESIASLHEKARSEPKLACLPLASAGPASAATRHGASFVLVLKSRCRIP